LRLFAFKFVAVCEQQIVLFLFFLRAWVICNGFDLEWLKYYWAKQVSLASV